VTLPRRPQLTDNSTDASIIGGSADRCGGRLARGSLLKQAAHMGKRTLLAGSALAMALALPACGPDRTTASAKPRTIYVAAVEMKGGATVDKEAYPEGPLPGGGGYLLKAPDDKSRWEVSTYRWDPGTIVVNEGDTVTLEIVGINGHEHPFTIEGYWVSDVVRRGKLTRVTFVADKPGIFKIICRTHAPSMQADLVVLAK
jgi:plastocyanin